jgi:predicted RNA-binding Zn ribbon-like protein
MARETEVTGLDQRVGRAPGALAAVQGFVNTLDIEQGTDELRDRHALREWLRSAGLWPQRARQLPTAGELARAVHLRETLRLVLRSHADHKRRQATESAGFLRAVADLGQLAAGLPVRLEVDAGGRITAGPGGSGVDAALARIMLIAAEATATGTWSRLKACSAEDCQWAFYDRSPTHNGCWCSMQICGARAKSRAYRKRAAARRSGGTRRPRVTAPSQ